MRGIWHILEAVMASVVIVGFLVAIASVYITKPFPDEMSLDAYRMLEGMDNRGVLRNYTESLNHTAIASEITIYSYNTSAQICDYAENCTGTAPDARNVWAGAYVVAGLTSYQPREVRFYIWPL
jgi:hypothetical protein